MHSASFWVLFGAILLLSWVGKSTELKKYSNSALTPIKTNLA